MYIMLACVLFKFKDKTNLIRKDLWNKNGYEMVMKLKWFSLNNCGCGWIWCDNQDYGYLINYIAKTALAMLN